jgi:5,10-methylenetetrahydromethanopterin reductase
MGLGAMKLADMEEYIRVVYGLLRGEIVETEIEGQPRKIQFLNPDANLFNTKDPIPLHVSAYGPRAQKLTAKLGAYWKCFIQDVPGALDQLSGMERSWIAAGHAPSELYSTAWVCGCVLRPGEAPDSERAVLQSGPRAATLLHRAADAEQQGWQNTMNVAYDGIRDEVEGYLELARHFQPEDARYLFNHRGHFVFVKPEERQFITAELIRRTTFTATEQELTQRVEALRSTGWSQIVIPIVPGQEDALEDWARVKAAFA